MTLFIGIFKVHLNTVWIFRGEKAESRRIDSEEQLKDQFLVRNILFTAK